MEYKTLTQLPPASALTGGELILGVQDGAAVKILTADMMGIGEVAVYTAKTLVAKNAAERSASAAEIARLAAESATSTYIQNYSGYTIAGFPVDIVAPVPGDTLVFNNNTITNVSSGIAGSGVLIDGGNF